MPVDDGVGVAVGTGGIVLVTEGALVEVGVRGVGVGGKGVT